MGLESVTMMMVFYGSWNDVLFCVERIHARRRKVDEDLYNDDGDGLEGNMDARQN